MRPSLRIGLVVCMLGLAVPFAAAQTKIAHFNSAAIIKLMPEAQDAQRQLDQLVAEWQKQLSTMQLEWREKLDDYEKRKLIMTDQRRQDTEKELRELDQKIAEYRNARFGQTGELFQKQSEFMKPVQDLLFTAVKSVAEEEGYDYILDKSGEILLMYSNEKLDVTPKILAKLNISPQTPAGGTQPRN